MTPTDNRKHTWFIGSKRDTNSSIRVLTQLHWFLFVATRPFERACEVVKVSLEIYIRNIKLDVAWFAYNGSFSFQAAKIGTLREYLGIKRAARDVFVRELHDNIIFT